MENKIQNILDKHLKWLRNEVGGSRADLSGADLSRADLSGTNLFRADLSGANLFRADLSRANLFRADLSEANLFGANLSRADLSGADLSRADLSEANLFGANLFEADLKEVKKLIKIVGVKPLNYYYKRIGENFESNRYFFRVGINNLRKGEKFAADERVLCSYPGFHFASKSWCAVNYSERRYEVKIQIPKDAQINEPWATDGKASASSIKIVQVIDTTTGKDVTKKFKNYADGYGNKILRRSRRK